MKYRAVVCRELGNPDVLRVEELDAPPLAETQARVNLHACGVNFPDLLMVAGKYQFKPDLPFVPGFESAGEVIEAAPGARVKVGDRVIYRRKTGGFAEQAVATPNELAPVPEGYSFDEAATYTVGVLTAYHALFTRGQLQKGERLLVTGAAGGVGMAAVAIGKYLGAEVIAACSSAEKCAATVNAGASHTINTSERRIDEATKEITGGRGVDCIYDPVGLSSEIALRALTFGGRILLIGFAADIPSYPANRLLIKCASLIGVRAGEYARHFPAVRVEEAPFIEKLTQIVRPHVSKAYRLEDAARALLDIAERKAIGRIVLHP
ncbi:MAG: NADPH:quinone oxidoreductase family protein [Hyphomicrobiales bacterium]|nr:NADPH:quinone oxidoreductase family protein [Hyphomicrobiales bacterium]